MTVCPVSWKSATSGSPPSGAVACTATICMEQGGGGGTKVSITVRARTEEQQQRRWRRGTCLPLELGVLHDRRQGPLVDELVEVQLRHQEAEIQGVRSAQACGS